MSILCGSGVGLIFILQICSSPCLFPIFLLASPARCYPEGFARRLLALWEGRRGVQRDLRHKATLNTRLTDRELFQQAPLQDPWIDAGLLDVWKYLWECKYVKIPDSWLETMKEFDAEVTRIVPYLNLWTLSKSKLSTWSIPNLKSRSAGFEGAWPRYVFLNTNAWSSTVRCWSEWCGAATLPSFPGAEKGSVPQFGQMIWKRVWMAQIDKMIRPKICAKKPKICAKKRKKPKIQKVYRILFCDCTPSSTFLVSAS